MVSNDRTILDEVLRRGMGEISSSTTEIPFLNISQPSRS